MNDITPKLQIEGPDGNVAIIYSTNDEQHEVQYKDKSGKRFFTEKFEMIPFEIVENMVNDWAVGKRDIT